MKKYVCAVCGWTTEAETAPAECPICKAKKFIEQEAGENSQIFFTLGGTVFSSYAQFQVFFCGWGYNFTQQGGNSWNGFTD